MQISAATLEDSLTVSYKAKHSFTIQQSSYTPQVFMQLIDPSDFITYVHANTCTRMLRVYLLRIVPNWEQSRCFSLGECLKKNCHKSLQKIIVWQKRKKNMNYQFTKIHGRVLSAYCYIKESFTIFFPTE
jgi:hypothetical protein